MRKNIFICIIFAVSISACTEELDKEINIEANSSLYNLSESEALTIAETFHKSVTSEPRTRNNNTAFGIKSTYRLHASEKTRALSSEELPLIYEVEINNGPENGRIIVSGDKRFQEVLAYMPSFNDSLYQVSLGPNVMMQMAKNTLLDKIQDYKNKLSTRSYPVDPIPGEVSVMIVPFCSTQWSQSAPHNRLLPKAWVQYAEGVGSRPGSAWYDNYYTGEAVISIAQAMAYLQPYISINGVYINWETLIMERNDTVPEWWELAGILSKYIYDTIGTYPVWGKAYDDKWPQSSIVNAVVAMETPTDKISAALNSSQCGLVCDKDQSWNLDIVKTSLLSLYPVLVGDRNRLAFLVDGYAINEENSTYLHCNFSKNTNFDGYFLVNNDGGITFELNGLKYKDVNLGIIANIRNK
ncbi:Spi family protease inhibitor [Bacteroides sp.]|uniref:Spi family protease inhibitor n=1 Tax=Bacteroides sp. TaxID=29523 RepID=UPI0040252B1A